MSDFKAIMHEICFQLGLQASAQTPLWELTGEAYSAPPDPSTDPLAVFKGPTSKGMQRKGREWRGKRKGRGEERRWRGDLAHPKM